MRKKKKKILKQVNEYLICCGGKKKNLITNLKILLDDFFCVVSFCIFFFCFHVAGKATQRVFIPFGPVHLHWFQLLTSLVISPSSSPINAIFVLLISSISRPSFPLILFIYFFFIHRLFEFEGLFYIWWFFFIFYFQDNINALAIAE